MSIDMREPFAPSLFSAYSIASLAFLAWGVGASWLVLQRGRRGLLGFGLLYPWLMFMTEFSSVRVQEVFVLYRSYLWVVGAFCLLPWVFAKVNERSAAALLTIITLAMTPISMERLATMSQPMFLWDDAEKLVRGKPDLPGAFRIYYNRGTERAELGMLDAAIKDFEQSLALNPDFAESYGNLGAAYAKQGEWDQAMVAFKKAIATAARGGRTYSQMQGNLGTAYLRQGDFKASVAAFSLAMDHGRTEGKPVSARDVHGRAQAYEKMGDAKNAQADYRESCRLDHRGCEKVGVTAPNEKQ
jgi:Tfp pilus assembly protein PilF